MRIVQCILKSCGLFAVALLLFCSFDAETDLGSGIINDVTDDKVNLERHYREYLVGSSSLVSYFSMPGSDDKGFGVHDVSGIGNAMVIGRKGNESSYGLVRFLITSDTNTSKGGRQFFREDDSLVSVKILFSRTVRDSQGGPCAMKVFSAKSEYAFDTNGTVLDTLRFADTALYDSITLPPGSLRDSIFNSCRSLDMNYTGDTFNFGLANILRDTIYRLPSNIPNLKISIRRKETGKNDTVLSKAYAVTKALYIGFDDRPEEREPLPAVSYASSRTAVFTYDAAGLWKFVNDSAAGAVNRFISGNVVLPCPKKDSTRIFMKCIISSEMIRDARTLDSLFGQTAAASIADTLHSLVYNKRTELQTIARTVPQPRFIHLYFRLDCDRSSSLSIANKEAWTAAHLHRLPVLTTIVHIP